MPMRVRSFAVLAAAILSFGPALGAQQVPKAIYTDPPRDAQHPARMEVLHIPSGDVKINGVAYLVGGTGVHPTFVLLHGLPGNEKNLDLAQAVRRAGWNAITFNYRGSWGSPGVFRFSQNLEDADAVLAFLLVLGRTYAAKRFTHEQATAAIVVSYYWHFVDVVWIGLFATIYLIK